MIHSALSVVQCLTWPAEGGREEVREILPRRPHLHTGGVVATSQTSTVLHHPIQADKENMLTQTPPPT